MLHRSRLARELNSLMGCSVFTAWNVMDVPHEDLVELRTTLKWMEQLNG
jgi:hypothetical protein